MRRSTSADARRLDGERRADRKPRVAVARALGDAFGADVAVGPREVFDDDRSPKRCSDPVATMRATLSSTEPAAVPVRSELSDEAKRLFARLHETFCGFVDHCDEQIGCLVAAPKELKVFDDTIVLFMSDNGASQEGKANGTTIAERFRT